MKRVDYVLVAEFDIEKGSTVSFQYPAPTGTETNILAELMLPDGAHNRDQDWTVFFLNQSLPDSVHKEQKKENKTNFKKLEAYIYQYTEASQDWEMLGDDRKRVNLSPDLISITEADGTLLKKISKSVNIQFQRMEPLYDVIIADEIALGIRLQDENDEKTFLTFLEDFVKPEPEKKEEQKDDKAKKDEAPAHKPFLYVLNLVRTKHIPGVKRGARTKAMAICTQHQYVHIFKPLLLLALDAFFDKPEESVPKELYNAVNQMDIQLMPNPSQQERRIIRASETESNLDKKNFKTKVNYLGIDIPMKVPIALFPDEVGDFSLITLINKFAQSTVNRENGIMVLFNALLRQQRIIFLGYGHPSGEVANYVLAACALLSPPLRGFTQRAFPYTNLVNVDNMLACPGFIAGVTNPRFEDLDKWWDVLFNIETGTVKLASHIPPVTEPEKYITHDNDFIAEVLFGISNRYSEDRIRAKFQEYAQGIVDIAFDDAEYPDDATKKKVIANNQQRVDNWKATMSYKNYKHDRDLFRKQRAIQDADVNRLVTRLRIRQNISEKEVLQIYYDFVSSINTDEQLIEFLSYLPENQGGLYPVAVSLFHPSEKVRKATVELFNRIDKLKAGSGFISSMNRFLKLAYDRNKYLLDKKSNEKEMF